MKKSTKIRIAVGAVMLAAAIALAIAFDGILTGEHTQMWQRAIYVVGIIGTGLGAVLGMIMGWMGYVYSYAALSVVMIPNLLSKPWDGIFVAAFFGAFLIWSAVSKSRRNKASATEESDESEPELTEEEQRFAEKLRGLTLVVNPWNSRRYRLVFRNKTLTAYYVGSDFRGIDETLLQIGDELRSPDRMDIVIPVESIRSISIRELPNMVREQALIKTSGNNYRFNLLATDENASLAGFLKDIAPGKTTVTALKEKEQHADKEDNIHTPDTDRIRLFRILKVCFGVYLGLVNLPWMFIDVPYKLFSVLSIIALPVLLIAYIFFPGELTMLEDKDCKGKVSIFSLMLFSAVLPALRSLIDFNITAIGRMLLLGAAVFALLMGVVLLNTKEWRSRKAVTLSLALLLLFYAPAAVAQINFDFDNSMPTAQQGIMIEKHISRSRRAPDSYYIKLRLSGGKEMQLKVGSEQYSSYDRGDAVTIYTFDGALDIPYVIAY